MHTLILKFQSRSKYVERRHGEPFKLRPVLEKNQLSIMSYFRAVFFFNFSRAKNLIFLNIVASALKSCSSHF